MARIEKTVFISYRRKDISWALAVYQYLTSQNYDVFFDYTSIPSGDFEQIIVSNIRARAHFVLILTPTALDRTSQPGDWLGREIEIAIDEKRNIIPLFFDGFNFGNPAIAERLTGKLFTLNRYNGLDIPSGYFLEAMERLRLRYLNVPLDAVLHPIPTEVRKVVEEQHAAADKALEQKKDVIEEIVKPAAEKAQAFDWEKLPSKLTPRVVAGIAMGVLLISLVLWRIANIGDNPPQSVAPEPTQTSSPTPTRTSPPKSTNTPSLTPTITPATPTPVGPYVVITGIRIESNVYVVDYEVGNFTPDPPLHVHMFFNTVPPERAGSPASGPWELTWGVYGDPPFIKYGPANRPANATKMCALVANRNHAIILGTGNCVDLP